MFDADTLVDGAVVWLCPWFLSAGHAWAWQQRKPTFGHMANACPQPT